jgi:hypothetical protein
VGTEEGSIFGVAVFLGSSMFDSQSLLQITSHPSFPDYFPVEREVCLRDEFHYESRAYTNVVRRIPDFTGETLTDSQHDRNHNRGPKTNSTEKNDDFIIERSCVEERIDGNPEAHNQHGSHNSDPGDDRPAI